MSQFGGYPEIVDIPAKVGHATGVQVGDLVFLNPLTDDAYETAAIAAVSAAGQWLGRYGVVLGPEAGASIGNGDECMVRVKGPCIAEVGGTVAIDDYLIPNWAGPEDDLVQAANSGALTAAPPTTAAHLIEYFEVVAKAEAAGSDGDYIAVVMCGLRA
jgi:hypothetical protein